MASVSLVNASSDLREALQNALMLIGLQNCIKPKDIVLLKPNLHGGPGHTSPQMLEALVQWAWENGAARVIIGDGPFWGLADPRPYFQQIGLFELAARTGAHVMCFHQENYMLLQPQSQALPPTIGIAQAIYDADVVINVPIPKTHFNTLVTLALKNIKGCLRPVDKKRLHEINLPRALAYINKLVAPRITVHILDGTMAYEGLGPSHAVPFSWGLIAASTDPVALDATICRLMGINPDKVRLITESAQLGVGERREENILILGEAHEKYQRRFLLPHEALAQSFPGLRILSDTACSVCLERLFCALEKCAPQASFGAAKPLFILLGAHHDARADIRIGRCACRFAKSAQDIAECPPDSEEIYRILSRHLDC